MITVRGRGITIAELKKIEPVTPDTAGRRWRAVRHIDLVNTIVDEVTSRGWVVGDAKYAIAREGADMAGALMFKSVKGLPTLPGMSFALGFLNSNSRRKALRLTVGVHIACCLNGMCTGTILLNRVHDHTIDLTAQIRDAMDRYEDVARGIPALIRSLQDRKLTPAEASHVVMEAGRRRLIGAAALLRVDREYRDPTFTEHGVGTSWAMLNAFTYAARPNINPTRQMEAYDAFRLLLPVADVRRRCPVHLSTECACANMAAEDSIEHARRHA